MKKHKIYLLLLLLSLCLLVLCSCRCDPAEREWYLLEMTDDVTFSNGVTEKLTISGSVDIYQPFAGAYAEPCQVEFYEDGGFFGSFDGEELSGTYTYKHNGFRDTGFTVNLENGEHFSGTSVSYYGGSELKFEFRGESYKFSDRSSHPVTKEEAELHTEYLIEDLRDLEVGKIHGRLGDFRGEITLSGDDFLLTSADAEYNLSSGEIPVWCSLLDKENKLSHLDEVQFGDCYFVINNYIKIGEPGQQQIGQIIVIYYIEPQPDEPEEPKPEKKALSEIYPWIFDDISSIKLTLEIKNLPAGYTKYHDYLAADEISACVSELRETELCEVFSHELEDYFLNGDRHKLISLLADVGGERWEIQFIDGLIYDGERWWKPGAVPKFNYDGALQSFIVYNDEISVFDREGNEVGTYTNKLSSIEFTVCEEEHNYSTLSERFTLVTEFGEITVYDGEHFWYKGQSYVAVGENNFDFLFCEEQ